MKFEELIINYKQNVKNIIKLVVKHEDEDLEQEVFVKAWKNSDKYQERGSFRSWISTVAKNVAKDYLKSKDFKTSESSITDDYALEIIKDKKATPEENVISIERKYKIIYAIESLKPKFKEVIILCEFEGLSYEEVAKKLCCPLGTIKSRVFNAKKELAIILKDLL